jgi:hypothetical protein
LDKGFHFFRFSDLEDIELNIEIYCSVWQAVSSEAASNSNPWVGPGGILVTLGSRAFDGMSLAVLILLSTNTGDLNSVLVSNTSGSVAVLLSQSDQFLKIWRAHDLGVVAKGGVTVGQSFVLLRQTGAIGKIGFVRGI